MDEKMKWHKLGEHSKLETWWDEIRETGKPLSIRFCYLDESWSVRSREMSNIMAIEINCYCRIAG